ncbi:hypothetical protein PV08_01385 [Exophiala spinifera]|uniref:Uncharacterized protein n=1 Tax=Exophiala spinifera TaxID=91928 RepID=A0A0D2A7P0_9EURO|nr:uncharacterized protein PV08_01385 [Exophiala spinifera]KIW20807.1 hypothetical protein PV08_01385 [Exophiala spinifera]
MPGKTQASSGMLDAYLYHTRSFTDRLAQQGRALRFAASSENDAAILDRAETDMTAMTDPALLQRAREDQQGLMEGSRSYS